MGHYRNDGDREDAHHGAPLNEAIGRFHGCFFISDSCSITFSSAIFVTDMQILSLESKTLKEFFLWVLIFLNRLRFLQFRCFYLLFKYITFVETLPGTDFKFTYREFSRPHRCHLGSYRMTNKHESYESRIKIRFGAFTLVRLLRSNDD